MTAATALLLTLLVDARAHPMSRDRYSLRTALRLDGERLDAVVVLEVPFDVVMKELKGGLDAAGVGAQAGAPARAVLDAYNQRTWAAMGDGLVLLIDGQPVPGSWAPSDNRYNGKGAVTEGFFLFIVEFRPSSPLAVHDGMEVLLADASYATVPMVYSAYVEGAHGWTVTANSAAASLPARTYDLNDPSFWVEDPALRLLAVRFGRAAP